MYAASFEQEDFVTTVKTGAAPAVPGRVGLQETALTEAAYESGYSVDVQCLVDSARSADTTATNSD